MNARPDAVRLRVMLVTDQYEPMIGGVPTATRELARGLAGRGCRVALVVPAARWRRRPARAGEGGTGGTPGPVSGGQLTVIRRRSVRWPWYPGARLGLLPAAAARRLIAAHRPQVIHVHSPLTLGVAAVRAARRHGIPVVYTNHYLPANARPAGRGAGGILEVLFYRYLSWFANRCDLVTAPTATALTLLRGRGLRTRSEAVSNGIDLAVYRPDPPDGSLRQRYGLPAAATAATAATAAHSADLGHRDGPPVVLFVGRLSQEKRADLLIEALSLMADRAAVLVLAGAGPDEPRLRRRAADLDVADRVRFTGFVPDQDLPGLYRLAAVFAIASEAELQSLATMEAMASGLPVVAVNAGALPELVRDGGNGVLTTPGDPRGLAAALDLICRDPGTRAAMGRGSLAAIQDHDLYRQLARWEFLYRTLAPSATRQAKVSDGRP